MVLAFSAICMYTTVIRQHQLNIEIQYSVHYCRKNVHQLGQWSTVGYQVSLSVHYESISRGQLHGEKVIYQSNQSSVRKRNFMISLLVLLALDEASCEELWLLWNQILKKKMGKCSKTLQNRPSCD